MRKKSFHSGAELALADFHIRTYQYVRCSSSMYRKRKDRARRNDLGRFHLHLLLFPFIYQFNSRLEALVCSSFAND